jgi:hypothetical protein
MGPPGELPAAHRLRRQPHRLARPASQQVRRVGVEGVEIHDRERRVEVGGGGVQALLQGLARYPPNHSLGCRAS